MYMMYVDESGDPGLVNSPTDYLVLSGVVIHESRWDDYLGQLIEFRRALKTTFEFPVRYEIHASQLISRPGSLIRIPKHDRLTILRWFVDVLTRMEDVRVINVVVDKTKLKGGDAFLVAWQTLLQRFDNTIVKQNFPGSLSPYEKGLVFADDTNARVLTQLQRRMRRHNPVPNSASYGSGYRNILVKSIVEDPNFRNSAASYYIQAADLVAYFLYQKHFPNSYIRKKGAQGYFDRLDPILCKVASYTNAQGIVYR